MNEKDFNANLVVDNLANSTEKEVEPAAQSQEQRQIKVGFTAAVLDNGQVVFNFLGNQLSLIELKGLSGLVGFKIDQLFKQELGISPVNFVQKMDDTHSVISRLIPAPTDAKV